MGTWLVGLALAAAAGAGMYGMYRQGFAVSKSIRALVFLFQPGAAGDTASVDSCSGWVRHAGRFRESRQYAFSLDAQLSKGDVEVSLLNGKKQELLKLNRWAPTGSIELDGKSRYYLQWRFSGATGKCALRW